MIDALARLQKAVEGLRVESLGGVRDTIQQNAELLGWMKAQRYFPRRTVRIPLDVARTGKEKAPAVTFAGSRLRVISSDDESVRLYFKPEDEVITGEHSMLAEEDREFLGYFPGIWPANSASAGDEIVVQIDELPPFLLFPTQEMQKASEGGNTEVLSTAVQTIATGVQLGAGAEYTSPLITRQAAGVETAIILKCTAMTFPNPEVPTTLAISFWNADHAETPGIGGQGQMGTDSTSPGSLTHTVPWTRAFIFRSGQPTNPGFNHDVDNFVYVGASLPVRSKLCMQATNFSTLTFNIYSVESR
jgi:hypothetical protein